MTTRATIRGASRTGLRSEEQAERQPGRPHPATIVGDYGAMNNNGNGKVTEAAAEDDKVIQNKTNGPIKHSAEPLMPWKSQA